MLDHEKYSSRRHRQCHSHCRGVGAAPGLWARGCGRGWIGEGFWGQGRGQVLGWSSVCPRVRLVILAAESTVLEPMHEADDVSARIREVGLDVSYRISILSRLDNRCESETLMSAVTLTRNDQSIVRTLMVFVALLSAVPVVHLIVDWIGGKPLRFTTVAVVDPPAVDDPALADGVHGVYTGEAAFTIDAPSAGQRLAQLVPGLVTCLVAVACLLLVMRLLRNVRGDDLFRSSSRRITRTLGLILFCYGLFQPFIRLLAAIAITTPMHGGQFAVAGRLDLATNFDAGAWWPVAVGLVVGVVGEVVFSRGRELADETEGLV